MAPAARSGSEKEVAFEFLVEVCYSQSMEEIISQPTEQTTTEEELLHQLEESKKNNPKIPLWAIYLGIFFIFYSLGFIGYWVKSNQTSPSTISFHGGEQTNSQEVIKFKKGATFGVDSPLFKDTAEGLLERNKDPNKPGTHILIRGDESQTAYLTSSVLDLDKYVGHKVKIWGETQSVEKVGWFMDVGKLQILD